MVHERDPVCLSALNNLLFVSTFHSLFFNPVIFVPFGSDFKRPLWISDNPAAVNIDGTLSLFPAGCFCAVDKLWEVNL